MNKSYRYSRESSLARTNLSELQSLAVPDFIVRVNDESGLSLCEFLEINDHYSASDALQIVSDLLRFGRHLADAGNGTHDVITLMSVGLWKEQDSYVDNFDVEQVEI